MAKSISRYIDGEKLEYQLIKNCYSQKALAEATHLTPNAISLLANRKVRPMASTLSKICNQLHCSPFDILADDEKTSGKSVGDMDGE